MSRTISIQKHVFVALAVALLALAFIFASSLQAQSSRTIVADPGIEEPVYGLVLDIEPVRRVYALGEVVEVVFRLTNRSGGDIDLPEEPTVYNGRLRVFVADGGDTFREYLGPGWSLEDSFGGANLSLAPGETFETSATLLYNFHPETEHLSPLYARQIERQHVTDSYLFTRPGLYRLRATLDPGEELGTVESAPAVLELRNPRGDDLAVWNVLRRDSELGHLLQTGKPLGSPLSERSLALAETLASLADTMADGSRAAEIRASLSRYRVTVEKIQTSVTQ